MEVTSKKRNQEWSLRLMLRTERLDSGEQYHHQQSREQAECQANILVVWLPSATPLQLAPSALAKTP